MPLRLSSFVHTVANGFDLGEYLAWVPENKSDPVVRLTEAVMQAINENRFDVLTPRQNALLTGYGVLTELSESEQQFQARKRALNTSSSILSIAVMPTSSCPLGCNDDRYGGYCGQTHSDYRLSEPMVSKRIDEISARLSSQDYTHLNLRFFGGEPLLEKRFILRFVETIRAITFSMGLTMSVKIVTSGIGLTTDFVRELVKMSELNIEITLDGPESVHDARRCTKKGNKTFARIISSLLAVAAMRTSAQLTIRCNVDCRNAHEVINLIKFLESRELIPACHFYIASVRDWGSRDAGTTFSSIEHFSRLEIEVFKYLLSLGASVSLLPQQKDTVCMALQPSPSVLAPTGAWYSCTEVPLSEKKHKSGDLLQISNSEWKDVALDVWSKSVNASTIPCGECRFLSICGGRCPKDWLKGLASCPSYKYNLDERIYMHAARSYKSLPII
jgi:uncharacterized protein